MRSDLIVEGEPDSCRVLASLGDALRTMPPWLHPFQGVADRVGKSKAESIAASLNFTRASDETLPQFVPQSTLPGDEPYEAFIARTFRVPTRNNLHDLLNGIVWLTFPKTKRHMNLLQAQEIMRRGVSGSRGAMRDALTVFDENGAILQAPSSLTNALQERDWNSLFVTHRADWQSAHLVLFGHALLEKLMQPRKPMTAHVWCVDDLSDDAVAASLTPERLIDKPFSPLPVLGVPGWCEANEHPQFYRDSEVFRVPTIRAI
jgi:hypothetical protein